MGKNNPYNELCSIFRLQHTSLGSEERLFLEHFQGSTFCLLYLHRSPLSLHMPGKICLAKHAQLLCLPVTGFTQPVLWITRPGEQGCLSAAQPHPSSKCKTERCYKEQFCCAWNCKQASTAHPLSQHTSVKACSS